MVSHANGGTGNKAMMEDTIDRFSMCSSQYFII